MYFRDIFGGMNTFGQGFMLGEVSCRYKAQAFFGDSLEARCGLGKVSRASFESLYQIYNLESELIVASGTSITVAYDFKTEKTVRISDDWRQRAALHEGWAEDELLTR